jgi:hypothetical protein
MKFGSALLALGVLLSSTSAHAEGWLKVDGTKIVDDSGEPVGHPHASLIFEGFEDGHYNMRPRIAH